MLVMALTQLGAGPTLAQASPPPPVIYAIDRHPYRLWRESWIGGESLASSSSIYSGSTIALAGDIEHPGWRLRTTAGYGRYTYRKGLEGPDGPTNTKLAGRNLFSDALLGYHLRWSGLTLKAFGGMAAERHIVDPRDPDRTRTKQTYGGKAALEAWVTVASRYWIAADLAWTSTDKSHQFGLRTGYTLFKRFDLGVETRYARHRGLASGRVGGFATWQIGDAGITIASGAGTDSDRAASGYGRISLFFRY